MEYLLFKEGERREMEEMIVSTTTESPSNQSIPTFLPWKLYDNPSFTHHLPHPHSQPPTFKHHHHHRCCNCTQIHTLHHPRPSCVPDLTFTMASTTTSAKTELENARAQIIKLKAELELERKMRKKMESLTKRMAEELAEERRGREAAERLCDELANRVSNQKAEIDRIEREMDEERRMLGVAEVLREERVQMKLEDAKLFYEERLLRLQQSDEQRKTGEEDRTVKIAEKDVWGGERKRWVSEPENPHIKRGIKGFVEFPRGTRALGSNRSNRNSGGNFKLECQKAQLIRILLKQRSPVQSNSLIMS